jgi:hypothetical protein
MGNSRESRRMVETYEGRQNYLRVVVPMMIMTMLSFGYIWTINHSDNVPKYYTEFLASAIFHL